MSETVVFFRTSCERQMSGLFGTIWLVDRGMYWPVNRVFCHHAIVRLDHGEVDFLGTWP